MSLEMSQCLNSQVGPPAKVEKRRPTESEFLEITMSAYYFEISDIQETARTELEWSTSCQHSLEAKRARQRQAGVSHPTVSL